MSAQDRRYTADPPPDPTRMVTLPLAVVEEAIYALRQAYSTALVVRRGSLDEPYSDEPTVTPYTRWVRPMGRRTHDACGTLQRATKEALPGWSARTGSSGTLHALAQDRRQADGCAYCRADEPSAEASA